MSAACTGRPPTLPNSLHIPNYLNDGTVAFFRDVVSEHGGDRLTIALDDLSSPFQPY